MEDNPISLLSPEATSESSVEEKVSEGLYTNETKIEKIVEWIVKEKLKSAGKVDSAGWIKELKDNLIYTRGDLALLSQRHLERLHLPLVLEYWLGAFCTIKSSATPKPRNSKVDNSSSELLNIHPRPRSLSKSPSENSNLRPRTSETKRSKNVQRTSKRGADDPVMHSLFATTNWFGMNDSQWGSILQIEKLVRPNLEIPEFANQFISFMTKEWFQMDQKMKDFFKGSVGNMTEHLNKALQFVFSVIKHPSIDFSSISIPHCMWELDSENFELFAMAFLHSAQENLGEKTLSAPQEEAWKAFIAAIGDTMLKESKILKTGWVDYLYRRQGNIWKKYCTKLTAKKLYFYKTVTSKKFSDKYLLAMVKDVSVVASENQQYAFVVQFGEVKKFFAADSESNRNEWIKNITLRQKALSKIPADDDSEEKSHNWIGTLLTGKKKSNPSMDSIALQSARGKGSYTISFDSVVHPVLVLDRHGIFLDINPAAAEFIGYEASELVGVNIKNYLPKNDAIAVGELLKYSANNQTRVLTLLHKDSREIPCLFSINGFPDSKKESFYIATVVEWKSSIPPTEELITSPSSASLNRSAKRTASSGEPSFEILNSLQECVVVMDSHGTIRYINPSAENLLGYTIGEITSKDFKSLLAQKNQQLTEMLSSGELKQFNQHVLMQHKLRHGLLCNLEVSRHVSKQSTWLIGFLTKKEDETFEHFLEENVKVLSAIDIPMVAIGEDGVILFSNHTFQSSFGYDIEELIGKNVAILMQKNFAKKHNSYIQSYLMTGKAKIIGKGRTVNVVAKGGAVKPCQLTITEKIHGAYRIFIGVLSVLLV
eukprot:TRINITY_DN4417_c0_g1_i1.p1 TRINITY_DN4417_c0_g1~~TRINITY_DN4417_c0_g1_i1.p1  ORF type:complete len:825 (+),score=175.52 TRINITY_DN4417_c0_g1_i1:45-2519(+)